jgi:hypothetical protein
LLEDIPPHAMRIRRAISSDTNTMADKPGEPFVGPCVEK